MPDTIETDQRRILDASRYGRIYGELIEYRLAPYLERLRRNNEPGQVLPFVRGLRFSALLTYFIREKLSGTDLDANWGQIFSESGTLLSKESDIIIHENGHYIQWNETNSPIMDYRFIERDNVRVVISCKSFIKTSQVDSEYADSMLPYVNRLWLFAECCGPRSFDNIRTRAQSYRYEYFWNLYTLSKIEGPTENLDGWHDFVERLRELS